MARRKIEIEIETETEGGLPLDERVPTCFTSYLDNQYNSPFSPSSPCFNGEEDGR
jgi:hypothetical protein